MAECEFSSNCRLLLWTKWFVNSWWQHHINVYLYWLSCSSRLLLQSFGYETYHQIRTCLVLVYCWELDNWCLSLNHLVRSFLSCIICILYFVKSCLQRSHGTSGLNFAHWLRYHCWFEFESNRDVTCCFLCLFIILFLSRFQAGVLSLFLSLSLSLSRSPPTSIHLSLLTFVLLHIRSHPF